MKNAKKILTVLLTAALALSLSATAFAASFNFEDGKIDDSIVKAYPDFDATSYVVADDPVNPGNKVLHIIQHLEAADKDKRCGEVLIPFEGYSEKFSVEFRICFGQLHTAVIALTEGGAQADSAQMAIRSIARPAPSLTSFNGGTEVVFGELVPNTWYAYKYVVDPAAKTYTLYVDGKEVLKDAALYKTYTGTGTIKAIAIGAVASQLESDIYVDDIKTYAGDKEPAPETTAPETTAASATQPVTTPTQTTTPVATPTADASVVIALAVAASAVAAVVVSKKRR